MRARDSQRSRVYAWERSQNHGGTQWVQTMSLDEVEAFLKPIWRTERGRYGKTAFKRAPAVQAGRGGGMAYGDDRLTFGRRVRNQYVALHELAHALNRRSNPGHGSRFVGILIGLLARHLGRDADTLLASAYEQGIKVDVRSIGAVPVFPWHRRLAPLMPCTLMEAAVELNVSWRVIQGASLQLVRRGQARWLRGKLVAVIK